MLMTTNNPVKKTGRKIGKYILYAVILFSVLATVSYWILNSPDIYLLTPGKNAAWIRLPEPYILHARAGSERQTVFYRKFNIKSVPDRSTLMLRAFKSPSVLLNNREISSLNGVSDNWKKIKYYDLTDALKNGDNEIKITVKNRNSHPAVWAYCREPGLSTDSQWYASQDGTNWIHAKNVTDPVTVRIFSTAPAAELSSEIAKISISCKDAFLSVLPALFIVFALVFLLILSAGKKKKLTGNYFSASMIRFGIMAVYFILAVNNFFKIPVFSGFDVKSHIAYIQYIANNMSLPLANQGWEFFQAPLFYFISAFVYKTGLTLFNYDTTLRLLHIIPLICGLIQIEIGYQTTKLVFSENRKLQILGTVICGIIPMNIYMSQTIGNEHLAGVLTATVLYFCIKQHYVSDKDFSIIIGIFLGLALLAKVSALLLIPLVAINYMLVKKDFKSWIHPVFSSLTIAFLISGWFYIRNYLYFNHFVIGGWWLDWWQDPGFRLISHFTHFGTSLVRPAFSYIEGFWDALYTTFWFDGYFLSKTKPPFPPWNYKWMFSCAWLALPATMALIFSLGKSFDCISRAVLILSRSAFLLYLSAILYMYLTLPIFSTAKATYALGLLPIYGILITAGFSPLMKHKWSQAAVFGWLACFGTGVYFSYFII